MGFGTVIAVSSFAMIGGVVGVLLEANKRKDQAKLLELLVKLALMGIAAYLFWDVITMVIWDWGGLPRM